MNKVSFFLLGLVCLRAGFGATTSVPAGGNLQTALNQASSGDTIILAAGATYTGHFTLPPNSGSSCITIQSSSLSALPGPGNRVSEANASLMPKLMTPDASSVLQITGGANNYCFRGIEFLAAPGVYVQDLIEVGTGSETSTSALPSNIDFDRDYIHGDPVSGGKRGIALNGGATTVENCLISNFTSTWQDTQALAGWNGPGPYRIINNLLEAGTETVAFGGAVPTIQNVVPSNILIQGNHFYKPLSWLQGSPNYAGIPVWVKNHLELKNAQHVKVDSNVFENNWVGADQRGFAFMFSVRTESDAVPWAVVNDVTMTNNEIAHAAAGIEITGHDDDGSGSAGQFLVQNNFWVDISGNWGGDGRLFQLLNGVQGATFNHNTAFQSGYLMTLDVGQSYNVNFLNNLVNAGGGVAGDGTGIGSASLAAWIVGGSFTNNVLIGAPASQYPAGNFFPTISALIGFINPLINNFSLLPSSPYKNLATDGTDIGANMNAVASALASAMAGTAGTTTPSGQ